MTDVSVTLRPPYYCPSEGHQRGISIQSSINLGKILLRIRRVWKTLQTLILVRFFIYQSSIISQILDLNYWMVAFFILMAWLSENEQFLIPVSLTHLVYFWIERWISKQTAPCITELKSFNDAVIRQHWGIHVITKWWRQIVSWNVKYLSSKNLRVSERN
jgi:hypothetical protein